MPAAYRLFDTVRTLEDIPDVSGQTLPAGSVGVIVEIFRPEPAFIVEFEADRDLDLPILKANQIAPAAPVPADGRQRQKAV